MCVQESSSGPLLVRQDGATALFTLNRPEARNAFSTELLHELRDAFQNAGDDQSVRAVVLTGVGDRAFSAGADIRQMRSMSADDARRWARLGHDVFQVIEDFPKPVIAAINGAAVGGGCEVTLACDFRIIAEGAAMGQPEIRLGLIPGWGGTQRLPRLVGVARAKDIILTGRMVSAAEALQIGLVGEVVPADRLLAQALEFAGQFAALPPLALGFAKRAITLGLDLDLQEGIAAEIDLISRCFETEDHAEGFAAFLEKRPPSFRGR
jgi:enoyl-CoA hydratase